MDAKKGFHYTKQFESDFLVQQNILKPSNRSVMLVAAGLPLFGCIAALCGNRFFGFVSICVAGMFGMTGIMLGFFFSAQYFVSFITKND